MINVNGIKVDCWVSGYPVWIHLEDDDNRISFTHRDVQLIINALEHVKKEARVSLPDKYKNEI